jgi:arylsulfatase A-like enzyme
MATCAPCKPGELQYDMEPKVTRDGKPMRVGRGVMPGPADTYIGYDPLWANASNTPFRMFKHWSHEGGISTPMIVHWPNAIKSDGAFRQQPGHLIDIMATCVDVSGASYPDVFNDSTIYGMEGVSLAPAFQDQPLDREAIYWEHEGNRAIRMGDWKLVSKPYRKPRALDLVEKLPWMNGNFTTLKRTELKPMTWQTNFLRR